MSGHALPPQTVSSKEQTQSPKGRGGEWFPSYAAPVCAGSPGRQEEGGGRWQARGRQRGSQGPISCLLRLPQNPVIPRVQGQLATPQECTGPSTLDCVSERPKGTKYYHHPPAAGGWTSEQPPQGASRSSEVQRIRPRIQAVFWPGGVPLHTAPVLTHPPSALRLQRRRDLKTIASLGGHFTEPKEALGNRGLCSWAESPCGHC